MCTVCSTAFVSACRLSSGVSQAQHYKATSVAALLHTSSNSHTLLYMRKLNQCEQRTCSGAASSIMTGSTNIGCSSAAACSSCCCCCCCCCCCSATSGVSPISLVGVRALASSATSGCWLAASWSSSAAHNPLYRACEHSSRLLVVHRAKEAV